MGAGYKEIGTLRIAGGTAITSTYGYLGYWSGSSGTATVTGTGSTWNNSSIYVAYYGTGVLNVSAGGRVTNSSAGYLGNYTGSVGTATITDTGSSWTSSSGFYVGNSGSGTLNVQAGGQVSNTNGYLGFSSGSTGTVTVTGTGSMWTNNGTLYVGGSGSGMLNIAAGGQVSNTSTASLGYSSGSTGIAYITGAGSTWANSGDLYVGFQGSGTLNVADGGAVTVGGTLYAAIDRLIGNGTISANGVLLDANLLFDSTYADSWFWRRRHVKAKPEQQ